MAALRAGQGMQQKASAGLSPLFASLPQETLHTVPNAALQCEEKRHSKNQSVKFVPYLKYPFGVCKQQCCRERSPITAPSRGGSTGAANKGQVQLIRFVPIAGPMHGMRDTSASPCSPFWDDARREKQSRRTDFHSPK